MRLFHFSDDPHIDAFVPRPVRAPSQRPAGYEWLDGPLVWAIEEAFEFLYLFPRDCPRILTWATPVTKDADRRQWLGECRAVAYVENSWLPRIETAVLYRYDMPVELFEDLNDAGMWVSHRSVRPLNQAPIRNPVTALDSCGVDLRVVESLAPLKCLWSTSLHASGIRLRNASHWRETPVL